MVSMDIKPEAITYFQNYIIKTAACWLWKSCKPTQYGSFSFEGKQHHAHHFSYQVAKGTIPARMVIRHTCDVPSCVNPDHLIIGTQSENALDAVRRGRIIPRDRRRGDALEQLYEQCD